MAKFVYFEVSCGAFEDKNTGSINTFDKVNLMFSKRVVKENMRGLKGEMYSMPISEIPFMFGKDAKFPVPAGDDYSARIRAVASYLDEFLDKTCTVEQITKNDRPIISYIEFDK